MTSKRLDIHNSEVPQVCLACESRHKGICGALTPSELTELSTFSVQSKHENNEEIIGELEDVNSYATVLKGVVKLTKVLEDGRQQMVGLQFAPDFVGPLFAEQSAVSADAAGEVHLCRLPKSAFEKMLKSNPDLENRVLKQTLRELNDARDWMVTLGRKTAREKVASFLLLLATHGNHEETSGSAEFDLPLTRSDIADFLGLTIETVSRQFTKLRTIKIIEIENNRQVKVPSLAALSAECG